jgi:hypothetical protein
MLKTSTLVLFLALASICAKAQDKWFILKLNDKVSVSFPFEPKKFSENNFGVRAEDETAYLVSFVDLLSITQMTKEVFNENVVTPKFADEFMEGLKPKLAKFTFGPHKVTTVKGLPTYQVAGRSEELKTNIYMNIIFVDGTSYSITSLVPDGKPTKNKDKFLTEIYVNGK